MRSPVTLAVGTLLLGAQLSCHALIVWSDSFTGQTAGGGPSNDFAGGGAGNDYALIASGPNATFVVNDTVGNLAPALALVDTGTTGSDQVTLQVTMNQFAPFDVSPASATPMMRVSFDLRVDSFLAGTNTQNARFIFRANNANATGSQLVIGFSYADLNDGDASTADLTLFADTQTGNSSNLPPKNGTAIGLIPGVGWQPGFDFGSNNPADAAANDTNDEFYRISFEYNSITGGISGTATQLSSGASVPLPGGLTLAAGTSFNNSVEDRFLMASSVANTASVYLDNLVFETIPEPTCGLIVSGGFAVLGFHRSRRKRN